MKHILIILVVLGALQTVCVSADLLECDERKLPSLGEIAGGGIGPKIIDSPNSGEHEVRDFFKDVGCKIKKGAAKVGEQAKRLGTDLKEGAIKWGERARGLGSDLKTKFSDFKEKLSRETSSAEEQVPRRGVLANVEIINPDILKAEQMCGHGHILDALGNCKKLRK